MNTNNRDFSTISPSAKALLLMKGYTNIPFAKQAAALITSPEKYEPDFERQDFAFWGRTSHLEGRYQSIDQLLKDIDHKNILELSSGFSFRGLDLVQREDVHYIDTDLPELIEQKKVLLAGLQHDLPPAKGTLETQALNALDDQQFEKAVARLGSGPITIVNEGLLMYLNMGEKAKLCANIYNALKERGGYWITADIYIRQQEGEPSVRLDDKFQKFLDDHNIEENKFVSFEAAKTFFSNAGFILDREAEPDYPALSSFPHLIKSIPPERMEKMKTMSRIQATWRLKIA